MSSTFQVYPPSLIRLLCSPYTVNYVDSYPRKHSRRRYVNWGPDSLHLGLQPIESNYLHSLRSLRITATSTSFPRSSIQAALPGLPQFSTDSSVPSTNSLATTTVAVTCSEFSTSCNTLDLSASVADGDYSCNHRLGLSHVAKRYPCSNEHAALKGGLADKSCIKWMTKLVV
ncbi:unnamed protein product [Protopolystoma xenopodis]|uniref:Uncharacterized protein n=1 Tax=Protopolystoma xenopodis TaxID=117903 RepID=A0A3S5ARI0_9PLAT|nr:unnamed protein product [Protopolystoma xenopodis]